MRRKERDQQEISGRHRQMKRVLRAFSAPGVEQEAGEADWRGASAWAEKDV
jgi:hypothetical protein